MNRSSVRFRQAAQHKRHPGPGWRFAWGAIWVAKASTGPGRNRPPQGECGHSATATRLIRGRPSAGWRPAGWCTSPAPFPRIRGGAGRTGARRLRRCFHPGHRADRARWPSGTGRPSRRPARAHPREGHTTSGHDPLRGRGLRRLEVRDSDVRGRPSPSEAEAERFSDGNGREAFEEALTRQARCIEQAAGAGDGAGVDEPWPLPPEDVPATRSVRGGADPAGPVYRTGRRCRGRGRGGRAAAPAAGGRARYPKWPNNDLSCPVVGGEPG